MLIALAVALLVLAGALPLLPVVAKSWQRSSDARVRAVGFAVAPFTLWLAFEGSLLAMGGVALTRFDLTGPFGVVAAVGFVLLQPVGIVLARRVAREGAARRDEGRPGDP